MKKRKNKIKKIEGAKHRGVKYPAQQAAERLAKIADKINCPTTGEQEIPKSFLRMKLLQRLASEKKVQTKRKKPKPTVAGPISYVAQPKATETSVAEHKESLLPNDYIGDGKIQKNLRQLERELQAISSSGNWDVVSEKVNPSYSRKKALSEAIDEHQELLRADAEDVPHDIGIIKKKVSKSISLKAKRMAKAKIKREIDGFRDFDDFKDQVKFGEVNKEPPKIHVRPKMKGNMNNLLNKDHTKNLLFASKKQNSIR